MRDGKHGDGVLKRKIKSRASAVAVTNQANLGDTVLLQRRKDLAHSGLGEVGTVLREPGRKVEHDAWFKAVGRARFTEEVRHDRLEAIAGIVVGKELVGNGTTSEVADSSTNEPVTYLMIWQDNSKNVSQVKYNDILGVVSLWSSDVAIDTSDTLNLTW